MINIEEMPIKELCKLYLDIKDSMKYKVVSYLKDRNYPLNDRWEVYLMVGESVLDNDTSSRDPLDLINNDLLGPDGPIYTDRYQTIDLTDLLDRLLELYDEDRYRNPTKPTYASRGLENLIAGRSKEQLEIDMKEKILESQCWSFTWDW